MMTRFFFVVCVLCAVSSPAIAQVAPDKAPARRAPSPAKSADKGPSADKSATDQTAAAKSSAQAAATSVASDDFIIGPEDVLEIRVWREPDLTTRAVVRPDGKIGVTLLGDVQAAGLTATQLKDIVTKKLDKYVEQPEVSVVVAEIRSQMVHLIGAVGRTGAYTLGGPLTVVELLARAGGIAEATRGDQIWIVRQRGNGEIERIPFNYKEYLEGKNLHRNIQLKNGDVVIVR
jgi:polysaccharide export outer membrane protein